MVIVQVAGENSSGVACIQYDYMIKAVASQRSDQPFDVGILPRTPQRAQNLFDAQTPNAPAECFPIYRVAIPKQIFRSAIPREGFDNLLARPLRGRILGDVEMNHLSDFNADRGPLGGPCRLMRAQCSRNRLRCQGRTVAGCTNVRTSRHLDQCRDSQDQRTLFPR